MSQPQFDVDWLAEASGARVVRSCAGQPQSFEIDSRQAGEGSLFFGIPGERVDGGNFAAGVLAAGAWGVVVTPGHSEAAAAVGSGAVLEHPDPVAALGEIASSHRQRLDCKVVGITGSTGKTSTKDIVTAVLSASGPTVATRGNRNTEIGMPLEILRADRETKFLVLEMAMRGKGQIAQLVRIAEPHVAVVTNIGPVHIELLGTIEAIAEAKSELIAGLEPGLTAIVPAHEPLLEPHLRSDLRTLTFGDGGDYSVAAVDGRRLTLATASGRTDVEVNFDQPHNRLNLLIAAAVADALDVGVPDRLSVEFSGLRGERIELADGMTVIEDCYNANPMSMRAALADLAEESVRRGGRSIAVLGDMLELGPYAAGMHAGIGQEAGAIGVDLLITVGPLAAGMAASFPGRSIVTDDAAGALQRLESELIANDTVLVKASRGIGLESIAAGLQEQI